MASWSLTVGGRMPVALFTLRGVDPQSIVSSETVVDSLTSEASSEIESSGLGDVFGISLDEEMPASVVPEVETPVSKGKPSAKKPRKTAATRITSKGDMVQPKAAVEFKSSFAEQFKAVRKQLGLSQFELARRLGTNQTTISLIERGKCVSRAAFLVKALRDLH